MVCFGLNRLVVNSYFTEATNYYIINFCLPTSVHTSVLKGMIFLSPSNSQHESTLCMNSYTDRIVK